MRKWFPILCFSVSTMLSTPAWALDAERFQVFANGKETGYLRVESEGGKVDVDYYVSDNGRGPKAKEQIELDSQGLPVAWQIKGESWAGGAVDETFRYRGNSAEWGGLAEEGKKKKTSARQMYVAAAGSPWALALYARYLMKQPDQQADVLPIGTLRLKKHSSITIGEGEKAEALDVFILSGLDIQPDFLVLDKDGDLFAATGGREVLVREGYGDAVPQLVALTDKLTDDVLTEVHRKVAHKLGVPWRVTNVRIFDPVKEVLSPLSTVVVFDDRIVRVEPGTTDKVPDGEKLIDGKGGTLMAGLVDMHAHEGRWMGYQRLAAGVTTVRDMGNDNSILLNTVVQRRLDLADGPRIVRAGYLEGKSKFSATNGIMADSLEEALAGVHWYADHGYPYLKTYNSIHPDWQKPLADEAHRLGMRVLGHVPAFTTADAQIEAGYEEVTHINQLMLQYVLKPGEDSRTPLRLTGMHRFANLDIFNDPRIRHTIALMKSRDVGLDTTIAAMERLNIQRDRVTPDGDKLYLDNMPVMFQRNRRRMFLNIPDAKTDAEHFKARDKLMDMMKLLHDEGVKMWPGTDDAVAYTLHRELELYVKAGFTPAETLRIASYDAIKELRLDHDQGTIEAGKYADFILLPGDPTKDITALRDVSLVAKNGVIYFPAELYEALNIKPFSPKPVVR